MPGEPHAQRHFCGFCGTPLSYWSERPRAEAEYIRVSLGSLLGEDLRDLEDMGLLSGMVDEESSSEVAAPTPPLAQSPMQTEEPESKMATQHPNTGDHDDLDKGTLLRSRHVPLPWFETLVAGSRLGGAMLRHSRGVVEKDGSPGSGSGVRVEWEIVEWEGGDDEKMEDADASGGGAETAAHHKRKMDQREAEDAVAATDEA